MQKEGKTIEQYVTDLCLKNESCNFESLSDSMIRDQIVNGNLDKKVRRQLLGETELTLDKAIRICQASERANVQLKSFNAESEPVAAMAVVHERAKKTGKEKHYKPRQKDNKDCNRCGTNHAPPKYPAYGKDCHKCGGKNFFARCCFTKRKVRVAERIKDASDSNEEDEQFFVETVVKETSTKD
ncbi:hypothetical protein M9458_045626, partial [Cirrhinus mrigala]